VADTPAELAAGASLKEADVPCDSFTHPGERPGIAGLPLLPDEASVSIVSDWARVTHANDTSLAPGNGAEAVPACVLGLGRIDRPAVEP